MLSLCLLHSTPVALLMNTQNKVQYSTMDHISKAPTCPVTELVMSHIGEEEEGMDVCSLHLFTILQSAVIVIIVKYIC